MSILLLLFYLLYLLAPSSQYNLCINRKCVKSLHATGDLDASSGRRGKKVNKYERFSTAPQEDPLEKTIRRIRMEESLEVTEKSSHIRGTTSPQVSRPIALSTQSRLPRSENSMRNITSIIPTDPSTFGYFQIGTIINPHGVKGEIKVRVESDFAEHRLQAGALLYLRKPSRRTPRPVELVSARKQSGDQYLIRIKGINTRIGALTFIGYDVFVPSSDRPELQQVHTPSNIFLTCSLFIPSLHS